MEFVETIQKGIHTLEIKVEDVIDDVTREIKSSIGCADEKTEDIHKAAETAQDVVGDSVDKVTGTVFCGLRGLLYPDAMDEDPMAEFRLRHPKIGQMVSIGCKLSVTEKGHVISGIQSGSTAHKLNFKENDLLFQIGEERVSMWPLSKVIQYLGEIEATFTLVVKRKKPNADNEFVFFEIKITISFDGETIEAEVTGTTFLKPSATYGPNAELQITGRSVDVYVYQGQSRTNSYTQYLNIMGNAPYVAPGNLTDSYKFKMHQLRGWYNDALVFCNEALNKAIRAQMASGNAGLVAHNSSDFELRGGYRDINGDDQMFYMVSNSGAFQLESVYYKGSFLANENGRLVLVQNPGSNIANTLFKMVRQDAVNSPSKPTNNPSNPNKPNIIHK